MLPVRRGGAELRRLYVPPVRADTISEEGRAELQGPYVPPVRADTLSEERRAEVPGPYVPNVRADATSFLGCKFHPCRRGRQGFLGHTFLL